MYRELIQPDVSVDKINMKNEVTQNNYFCLVYPQRSKDNLGKCNWHVSIMCVLCHHDDTIIHLFFHCKFVRSIWTIIQVASNLYFRVVLQIILTIGYMELIANLEFLSDWEHLP